MAANPVIEKRNLLTIFAQPNPAELLVSVAISGEVNVSADDGTGTPVNVLLQPSDPQAGARIYNLLDFAPIAGWRNSSTLMRAVTNGWLSVYAANPAPGPTQAAVGEGCCEGKLDAPANAQEGDILVFIGGAWVRVAAGASGAVLTSNGLLTAPAWAATATQSITNHLPLALDQSTDSAGFIAIGSFALTAGDYDQIDFVTLGVVTGALLSGIVQLWNLTDAVQVVLHTRTGVTSPSDITSASLVLPPGKRIYEVRHRVTGGSTPADRVFTSWAGFILTRN